MTTDLEAFLTEFPLPPKIKRGQAKRQLTMTLTDIEFDAISQLVSHPNTRDMFDRKNYEVMRHALFQYVYPLMELLDGDWKPTITQLRDTLKTYTLQVMRDAIAENHDQLSIRMHTLLEFNGTAAALEEYDEYLEALDQMPDRWRVTVKFMMHQHPELDRFFKRLASMDLSDQLMLKAIEEKHN
jgi:hypothetical protein